MMRCFAEKSIQWLGLLGMLFLWTACERTILSPDPGLAGYDYFPLEKGEYRIYHVYRVNYNFNAENDTLIYQ